MPKLLLILFVVGVASFAHAQAPVDTLIPQVTVTVNVVDVVLNDEHREGVDWGAIVSDYHTIPLKKTDNPLWADKKYRLSIGTVSPDDYDVLLEALDTVGVITQHPHEGQLISVGKSEDIILPVDQKALNMTVIPDRDGRYKVVLETQLSQDDLMLIADIDLTVTTPSTVVIGSIFKEHEITKTHKFPLLGDLPLVGLVFRSHGRLIQRTESIIFLSIN